MPRVHHVKKARKAIPHAGVKAGESYYWWKFRTGGRGGRKVVSKSYPKRSELTQSEFYAVMYDAEDSIPCDAATADDLREVAAACRDSAQQVRDAGEECRSKRDNMPDGLQDSETGQMLEERADACERIADELETLADELEQYADEHEDADPEAGGDDGPDFSEEARRVSEISWDYP